MSAIRELWLAPTFKRSAIRLLKLPTAMLDELVLSRDLTVEGVEPGTDDWLALQALRTMYDAARDSSVSEVVEDVTSLARDESEDLGVAPGLAALSALLETRPMFERRRQISRLRAFAHPQVEVLNLDLDFRAVDFETNDKTELVPMITMQLAFDEPVAGVNSITVGISEATLDGLSEAVDRVRRQYTTVSGTLQAELLAEDSQLNLEPVAASKHSGDDQAPASAEEAL
ncbi:hypothetical protein ACSMXN_17430 [Jatrophihabitans sp. DSM 45814]